MVINFNFEIMKIKNIKILLFAFLFLPLMLVSCDEDDKNDGIDFLENDGTKAEQFAGDWYIVFQLEGITLTNPAKIHTFNTAANNKNEFWIQDFAIWGFQIKAQGSNDLTFASIDGTDVSDFGEDATITNGKILIDAAKSKTGNVTDSIYMEVVFESDPGETYVIAGHKRTRWPEDDY